MLDATGCPMKSLLSLMVLLVTPLGGFAAVMQQSTAQTLSRLNLNLNDEDKAAYIAMQNETMDEALGVIAGPEMRSAMVKIYSEVFSKQELDGLAAFMVRRRGRR
jgi:hypothetical protein